MARMTEEEADALDELWTKTTPAIDTGRPGYFTQQMAPMAEVDDFLRARVDAAHKTPSEVIGELVRKEIGAVVE
jgi:hypothetical protein